jgi:hypothetical protein
MHPGRDCNECHLRKSEGPIFGAAGTVFSSYDAVDDCYGIGEVTVEITDANGKVHTARTHASGNFYLEASIEVPYTAVVLGPDGSERPMIAEQTVTDCNRCHTAQGTNMAPGRIIAP